jgi:osmotically-inducible protein OsmY
MRIAATVVEVHMTTATVTLTGTVRTWRDRDSAERSVADGPRITTVINHIVVAPAESDDTYELC